jgi:hypothetical protein
MQVFKAELDMTNLIRRVVGEGLSLPYNFFCTDLFFNFPKNYESLDFNAGFGFSQFSPSQ